VNETTSTTNLKSTGKSAKKRRVGVVAEEDADDEDDEEDDDKMAVGDSCTCSVVVRAQQRAVMCNLMDAMSVRVKLGDHRICTFLNVTIRTCAAKRYLSGTTTTSR